jgi:hypothetical protein
LSVYNGTEADPARASIGIAKNGHSYAGASRPEWYSPKALHALFAHVVPETATVAEVVREVFDLDHDDRRMARDLGPTDIEALHAELRRPAGRLHSSLQ